MAYLSFPTRPGSQVVHNMRDKKQEAPILADLAKVIGYEQTLQMKRSYVNAI
ncbi:hypothetical protein S7335_1600 [Synechococcus sp. PCC 7335]|uniref:hypothetical protein n=1 Tax=Synechococcus sp. (strain ATCC 29403 / PCC 7335) TaxID=91464 RepID=UPI00017EB4FB|nr:hypothetical protein [Synechococcus sp. PCC 7335]EDX83903.1 hypothetical protein S7335_1600 [Synechococcus sp. PCC 7335]